MEQAPFHPTITEIEKERLNAYFHEYDKLREHITTLSHSIFYSVGIISAAIFVVISASIQYNLSLVLVPPILIIGLLLFAGIMGNINLVGEHLVKVENSINRILKYNVLTWETDYGWAKGKYSKLKKEGIYIFIIGGLLFTAIYFISVYFSFVELLNEYGVLISSTIVIAYLSIGILSAFVFLKSSKVFHYN